MIVHGGQGDVRLKCIHKQPIHKSPVEHMGRGRVLFSCSAHAHSDRGLPKFVSMHVQEW